MKQKIHKILKIFLKIAGFILAIYLVVGTYLFFTQKSMIYFPENQDFYKCPGFSDYEKLSFNKTRFYLKERSDNIIVYYHGNAGSACSRSFNKELMEKYKNYSVMFVEYSGYSNDNKKPSKKLILKDVENINSFIISKKFKNIVVYGESIGSGPASYQASIGKVNSLILITPFSDFVSLAQSKYKIFPMSLMLTEDYDNTKYLKNFNGNIIILHGNKDNVIPYKFGEDLFYSIKSNTKDYFLIRDVGHNDIYQSKSYKKILNDFLKDNLN